MEHVIIQPRTLGAPVKLPQYESVKNELIYDLPFEEYIKLDTCANSSSIKEILTSPWHYLRAMINGQKEEENKDLAFGRAAHMMILEPVLFRKLHVVEPVFDGYNQKGELTTNANCKEVREKRKAWTDDLPDNALVLTQSDYDSLIGIVDSIMHHKMVSSMLGRGRFEVTGTFVDPITKINCRVRFDILSEDANGEIHLLDLKTAMSVKKGIFSRQIERLLYHFQMAFYYDAFFQITGRYLSSVSFVPMEKTDPYPVCLYPCDDDMLDKGRVLYQHSMMLLDKSLKSGKWPRMQNQAEMISLPNSSNYIQLPEFDYES